MPLKPPNVLLNLAHAYNPVGNHMQTASSVAITLSPPAGAMALMMQNTGTKDARYVIGGAVSPTTAKGFCLKADLEPVIISVGSDSNIVIIDEETGALVEYQWLGVSR